MSQHKSAEAESRSPSPELTVYYEDFVKDVDSTEHREDIKDKSTDGNNSTDKTVDFVAISSDDDEPATKIRKKISTDKPDHNHPEEINADRPTSSNSGKASSHSSTERGSIKGEKTVGRILPTDYEISHLNKCFVGNIPPTMTVNDLIEFFSKFGNVLHCNILYDPKHNARYGFLSIDSRTVIMALTSQKLIEVNGHILNLKPVRPNAKSLSAKNQTPSAFGPRGHFGPPTMPYRYSDGRPMPFGYGPPARMPFRAAGPRFYGSEPVYYPPPNVYSMGGGHTPYEYEMGGAAEYAYDTRLSHRGYGGEPYGYHLDAPALPPTAMTPAAGLPPSQNVYPAVTGYESYLACQSSTVADAKEYPYPYRTDLSSALGTSNAPAATDVSSMSQDAMIIMMQQMFSAGPNADANLSMIMPMLVSNMMFMQQFQSLLQNMASQQQQPQQEMDQFKAMFQNVLLQQQQQQQQQQQNQPSQQHTSFAQVKMPVKNFLPKKPTSDNFESLRKTIQEMVASRTRGSSSL